MSIWQWVGLGAGVWLAIACLVGLTIGLIARHREVVHTRMRQAADVHRRVHRRENP